MYSVHDWVHDETQCVMTWTPGGRGKMIMGYVSLEGVLNFVRILIHISLFLFCSCKLVKDSVFLLFIIVYFRFVSFCSTCNIRRISAFGYYS